MKKAAQIYASRSARSVSWGVVLLCLIAIYYAYGRVTTSFDAAPDVRTTLAAVAGALGLLAVFLQPRIVDRAGWLAVLMPALVVRLMVLPAAPSDDVYRYLWEGDLTAQGIDVYAVPADDASLTNYRDENWQRMNHKDKPTAYPPLATLTFAALSFLGGSVLSLKLALLVADLALIVCLLWLLRQLGKPEKWAAFYALSPLAVLAYAGEGHYDVLMILPLVAALVARAKLRWMWVAVLMALSIHYKVMTVALVPFVLWRAPRKAWVAFAVAMVAVLMPFAGQLPQVGRALVEFGATRSFNGPLYQVAQWATGDERFLPNLIVLGCNAVLWISLFLAVMRRQILPLTATTLALAGLVFCLPTVHFWYVAWVLPLVAISPRASWLSLSIFGAVYFQVWAQPVESWGLTLAQRWIFWLPFVLLLLWEVLGRKALLHKSARLTLGGDDSRISVVIPTCNPGGVLQKALASLQSQTRLPNEIIISDAGTLRPQDGAILIKSPKGRGEQIRRGVEAAANDWVLILHADAVLQPQAVEALMGQVRARPDIVGGCLGQRFDRSSPKLLLVEVLNELRALFGTTSFGDQAQFLHRPTALKFGCLTDQPLMEDIELCDRLRPHGPLTYVGGEVTVSAEKWRPETFWKRFGMIVAFFWQYRLRFWKGAAQREELARDFYRRYYGEGS